MRKLRLNRETVRDLSKRDLRKVGGGMDGTQDCPTWPVATQVLGPITNKLSCNLT